MSRKLRLKISVRLLKKKMRRKLAPAKKVCRFESNPEMRKELNYKNIKFLEQFQTESGKIISSRASGNSVKWQRELTKQIKLARYMGLLPYCSWSKS